jgi:hypothetical protein
MPKVSLTFGSYEETVSLSAAEMWVEECYQSATVNQY